MNKTEQLEALITHFCNGNNSQFAAMLGLNRSTITSWKNRCVMDIELIKEIFPQVSGDWLLTGEGEMLVADNIQPSAPPAEENPEDISIAACFMLLKEYMKKFSVLETQIKQTDAEISRLRELIEKNLN